MAKDTQLTVKGKRLEVSNLDKVLYPKAGFTKGQVIDYYIRISPFLLPHLKDRPLTLKRYPNGVDREFFYEKRCPTFRPKWLKTAPVWSERKKRDIHFCLANDLPSLVWAANLADLELHTSLSRYPKIERPTMMVFDLDPGAPADVLDCAEVALWLRHLFEKEGLEAFPKTTGSKGIQVYVPLNKPVTYDETKEHSRTIAMRLTEQHPDKVLFKMQKNLRSGKVFIDWSQNDRHKTTVCVYSLRAKDHPTVSTPLRWSELEKARRSGKAASLRFDTQQVLKRVEADGDLFAPVLKLKQALPKEVAI